MTTTRRATLLAILALSILIALPGCRTFVQNVTSPMPLVTQATDKEIEGAIIRAGARTGWEIVPERPGLMTGTILVRGKHSVVVEIAYTQTDYTISYKSSVNMEYKNGKIHGNYATWVANLDKNIRIELASLNK